MMGRPDELKNKPGGTQMGKLGRPINADVDWSEYLKFYSKVSRDELLNDIAGTLLQTKRAVSASVIEQYTDSSSKDNFIKTATIQIMSTPEYQLC
jgi:hypothetical protein